MMRIAKIIAVLGFLALCGSVWAQWSEPVQVTEVSTKFDEWTPFLSFDGLTLYFGRLYTDSYFYARIFAATREEPYGPFTSVSEVLRSQYHVLSPWVSPDNLRMYYHNELPTRWVIKVSERASVNDPWPQGTTLSELSAVGKALTKPALTADELTIFFTSRHASGGQGGIDMWMANRPDRNSPFGNIRNLVEINSSAYERVGSVSPDGLALYFSSDRNGQGQFFVARRESLDEPFGTAEHLSSFDAPGGAGGSPSISSDGKALYFARTGASGRPDIWVSYLEPHEVSVDIKPGSCPNPLNVKSQGVLPVAILGSEEFDVNTIDVASIALTGASPIRSSFEDVSAIVSDGNECECTTAGPDGYTDLTLKFATQAIVDELVRNWGELVHDQVLTLTLTGLLFDETAIEGGDCVVVRGKASKGVAPTKADINEDNVVDFHDFVILADQWLKSYQTE